MAAVPETDHLPAPGVAPGSIPWLDYNEDAFVNARGITIYTHSWQNKNQPVRDVVFLQHGYGDHSNGHLSRLGLRLAESGFAAFALDCQGCGFSRGDRMFVEHFDHYVEDLIQFRDATMTRFPERRAFLYGESMGGCIAIFSSLRRPGVWAGIVLSAPMIKIAEDAKPPKWQVTILRALAFLTPKWAIVPDKDTGPLVFKNPESIAAWRADPLQYRGRMRLGTGVALLVATEQLEPILHTLADPFVVLHGTGDLMTDPAQSLELFRRAAAVDKEAVFYDGFFHALTEEPSGGAERYTRDVLSWLEARSGPAPEHVPGTPHAAERYVAADCADCAPFHVPSRDVVVNAAGAAGGAAAGGAAAGGAGAAGGVGGAGAAARTGAPTAAAPPATAATPVET